MGRFSVMFNELARSFSVKSGKNFDNGGKEAADSMAKEAKKHKLVIKSSGIMSIDRSNNFVSALSKRGEKGVNQDCFIVWEEFGCQKDMFFYGIFDGHGSWGHFVAKKACAAVDQELRKHRNIDTYYSGTTVRQGDILFVANIGDSRAVLATISHDDILVPIQLTVDFKPSIPQEIERIVQCNGRVFCLDDEPGVQRVWTPNGELPGLAMSRAFGDFCVKDFGLVSMPEVTQRNLTSQDQFVVLATDGVWDVISNQEAIQIVSSTPDQAKASKCLIEHAKRAWKRNGKE